MNERPRRRPLVPRWLIISIAAALVIVIGAVLAVVLTLRSGLIAVPAVVGQTEPAARAVLTSAGFKTVNGGQRFSMSVPKGAIISQEPTAGSVARRGNQVTIIISAGSENLPMPDVVGQQVADAKASLEGLGLLVTVDTVETSAVAGTVLATYPAAGVDIRSGSTVRLSVAGSAAASSALLPFKMDGVTVVLDPAPVVGTVDATLEVSRRLQALLEASGAKVVITRSATSTDTAAAGRAAIARETSATVIVTLETASSGSSGLQVTTLASANASATALATAITEAARVPGQTVNTQGILAHPVLAASIAPGARVVLGSTAATDDVAHFADPAWADSIARAVYRALGATFGRK